MWRTSLALCAVVASAHLIAPASADSRGDVADRDTVTRAYLDQQLADQTLVVDRAIASVKAKLAEIDALRTRRLAAISRLLDASNDGSIAAARRRGVAQLLADRDLAERTLLANELRELETALRRIADDAKRVADLALPPALQPPARGTIERRFGTFEHAKSDAVLSRRGLDIETAIGRSPVVAPADAVVKYAGPMRGLDGGVILDHGTFSTVIGKLGEITVPVGAKLVKGDRIGRTVRHRVYFEVRAKLGPGGMPIDPAPLLDPEQSR